MSLLTQEKRTLEVFKSRTIQEYHQQWYGRHIINPAQEYRSPLMFTSFSEVNIISHLWPLVKKGVGVIPGIVMSCY